MLANINLKHRYWVFAIPQYYPAGGLADIVYTSDDLSEAENAREEQDMGDWAGIFDAEDRTWIEADTAPSV